MGMDRPPGTKERVLKVKHPGAAVGGGGGIGFGSMGANLVHFLRGCVSEGWMVRMMSGCLLLFQAKCHSCSSAIAADLGGSIAAAGDCAAECCDYCRGGAREWENYTDSPVSVFGQYGSSGMHPTTASGSHHDCPSGCTGNKLEIGQRGVNQVIGQLLSWDLTSW